MSPAGQGKQVGRVAAGNVDHDAFGVHAGRGSDEPEIHRVDQVGPGQGSGITRVRSCRRNAQISQLRAGYERLCQGLIAAYNGGSRSRLAVTVGDLYDLRF
jgi:hypothetical protein